MSGFTESQTLETKVIEQEYAGIRSGIYRGWDYIIINDDINIVVRSMMRSR